MASASDERGKILNVPDAAPGTGLDTHADAVSTAFAIQALAWLHSVLKHAPFEPNQE